MTKIFTRNDARQEKLDAELSALARAEAGQAAAARIAAILVARPEIGELCREGQRLFYVTVAGEPVEAKDPADLPSAEEIARRETIATLRASISASIEEAQLALDAGDVAGFHLVTERGMAVCAAERGGYRLTAMRGSCDNLVELLTRRQAERMAANWNAELTDEQRDAGCRVRAQSRQETLEQIVAQARELVAQLPA